MANQIAHEAKGKRDRDALVAKLDTEHAKGRKRGAARAPKANGTGMNAGTWSRWMS